MAFPVIVIVQNISIYVFPFLLLAMYELTGKFITIKKWTQIVVILFGVGAIASVVYVPDGISSDSFDRAIMVLPNYLYWVVLILFLSSYGRIIQMQPIYKGIYHGVIFTIIYYFVLGSIGISSIPIFKSLTQNAFAFLLICYTPIIVWYTKKVYGLSYALLFFTVLVVSGLLSGSRSGSLLVFSGGMFTFIIDRKSMSNIFLLGISIFLVLLVVLQTPYGKELIFGLNSRTYDLIYNNEEILETDRSYLVRLAQIEKSLLIFEKYPINGIGLNNFTSFQIRLPGNFEGAELVINKPGIDEASAHNSYFGFLAEGGLLLVIPFLLMIAICIVWFVKNVNRISPVHKPLFLGLIHMCVHLYFIYAILNVFAWFLIGLCLMVVVIQRK